MIMCCVMRAIYTSEGGAIVAWWLRGETFYSGTNVSTKILTWIYRGLKQDLSGEKSAFNRLNFSMTPRPEPSTYIEAAELFWSVYYLGLEINDGETIDATKKPWKSRNQKRRKGDREIDCKTNRRVTKGASAVGLFVFHGLLTAGLAWWIDQ